ncbi:LysR family transcriptional regulator [Massilia sp. CF038]|uniref:LysR family transcriptional regulator n=1 Tax=Massilia sp. CF038 TaxID=1881045 RepID=UPI000914411F|nr:LysR family transcriptional regulator [Massilia sp. CF038]SHH71211.1 DNA-binding transcriptional regulator, LysR family [Massilia sp. CF038]
MDRLDELHIFTAILDAGSLNGAARKLRRSAPAVTRALAALEERVGLRLVERTTRKLAPTQAGMRLAEMARRVLADYEAALREEEGASLRGMLRITAPHVFGRRHVTPAIIDFLDQHPELQVELVFNDRNIDLIEHGIDLAVRIGTLGDTSMVARQVGEVRRVLVASPAYLAAHGEPLTPAALERHDVIFNAGLAPQPEWRFRDGAREVVVRLTPRLSVNEIDAILMALLAGRGIGRPLSYQVAEQLETGALVRLLRSYEPAPLPVQLLVPSARHMAPRVRACFDFLAARLGGLDVIAREP